MDLSKRPTDGGSLKPVNIGDISDVLILPVNITGGTVDSVTAVANPVNIQASDSPSIDAFGRWRVSEPTSRFDAQFTYGLQPLLYEPVTNGSGSAITHDTTNRAAIMTFANTPAGGLAYMQSHKHLYYHPGNSHLIFVTFNFLQHTAGITKIAGYGDLSNNGVHLISNGTGFAWRILSNTSLGDETVTQANWNLDRLDGSGASGVTLDVSKTQIAVIDLQALYVGRVRVGFDIDGNVIYCHEFSHANRVVYPYIQTATLPIICGMTCSDTVSDTMQFYCATVRSEGATLEEEGFGFSVEGTVTASSGARTHILSLRPALTFNSIANRINFILESVDVLVTGNNPVLWELCVGQAISGTTAFNAVNATYSGFEFNTAGTISGNPTIVIAQGYAAGTNQSKTPFSREVSNRYPITLNAAGAVMALGTLSLIVTGIGGTSATRASLNWREIR